MATIAWGQDPNLLEAIQEFETFLQVNFLHLFWILWALASKSKAIRSLTAHVILVDMPGTQESEVFSSWMDNDDSSLQKPIFQSIIAYWDFWRVSFHAVLMVSNSNKHGLVNLSGNKNLLEEYGLVQSISRRRGRLSPECHLWPLNSYVTTWDDLRRLWCP